MPKRPRCAVKKPKSPVGLRDSGDSDNNNVLQPGSDTSNFKYQQFIPPPFLDEYPNFTREEPQRQASSEREDATKRSIQGRVMHHRYSSSKSSTTITNDRSAAFPRILDCKDEKSNALIGGDANMFGSHPYNLQHSARRSYSTDNTGHLEVPSPMSDSSLCLQCHTIHTGPVGKEEIVYRRDSSETLLIPKIHRLQINPRRRLNMLGRTLDQLLIAASQLEPPLQQGRSRLRWECKCGERFFGDVTELQKNGIAKLISRMERSSGVKLLTSSSSPGSDAQIHSFQSPVRLLQAAIGKITSSLRAKTETPVLPQHNSSNSTATRPTPSGTPALQQTLHLMACMHKGRYGKELYQDRVETISNDRELFTFLGEQYTRHKGRFKKIVSLKNIQGIFFVKFRLPMGSSVEIRHHDPCCVNAANTPCSCIPPPPKVEPSPSAEYRCIPGPPETYPPVMSEQLIHMLNSPSCIDETETWILDLLPKRICGELRGKAGQPTEGWGIYYKEGWDRDMITFMILAVFLLGSLLFGVLWSKFKMDVQGAFGVSAYMGTACGIFVAIIAMRAER